MTFKTSGIIIGKRDGKDADRIYTLYTKEHGKIVALAKSAKKITSKLAGHLDLFTYATCTIARGKGGDHIATVDVIERFLPSMDSSERLIAGLYCLECTDQLIRVDHPDQDIFQLLVFFSKEIRDGQMPASTLAKRYLYTLCQLLGIGKDDNTFSYEDDLFPHLNTLPKSQAYFEHLTQGVK